MLGLSHPQLSFAFFCYNIWNTIHRFSCSHGVDWLLWNFRLKWFPPNLESIALLSCSFWCCCWDGWVIWIPHPLNGPRLPLPTWKYVESSICPQFWNFSLIHWDECLLPFIVRGYQMDPFNPEFVFSASLFLYFSVTFLQVYLWTFLLSFKFLPPCVFVCFKILFPDLCVCGEGYER